MIPPMKNTGMNTAASERVMETMVNPISREPLSADFHHGFAHFHVPHDVFEHHDGVIDDEARPKA